jgi:Glutaminase
MPDPKETDVLTLAKIRQRPHGAAEYLFNERQRIYGLGDVPAAGEAAARLDEALEKKARVKVVLDSKRGLIQRVAAPTPAELEHVAAHRLALTNPDKVVRVDVSKIDPTTFDYVDIGLKAKSFLLCKKVVPNYAKAKKVFDYCAGLSCHLPGPYDTPPCIPFQYVIDGCYARAHQMRRIITEKFKHCCEKVFSFANQGNDTLAVKADKWGGCCVTWWYHVAPLIRVRVKLGKPHVIAMVIDPGMFDQPVPLSTWLGAQENATCSPNAHVSMYSIQPGHAYWPTNYAGTTFAQDPGYVLTQQTLLAYANLTTCP